MATVSTSAAAATTTAANRTVMRPLAEALGVFGDAAMAWLLFRDEVCH